MDVLLFSDNVAIEDEVGLKRRAHERGLLVMGPGAGTAIVDGVALGFANVVAPARSSSTVTSWAPGCGPATAPAGGT